MNLVWHIASSFVNELTVLGRSAATVVAASLARSIPKTGKKLKSEIGNEDFYGQLAANR
jgi:hypothetical protein